MREVEVAILQIVVCVTPQAKIDGPADAGAAPE